MIEKSPIEKQSSGTAMATAFMRALAAHDSRKEIRGHDYLAEIFLEEEQKKPLNDPAIRAWVMKNKIAPGAYEFMIARTAFFDEILEQALRENIGQVVILGAGYDSRPYRFGEFIQDTQIFELDSEPTQTRKKECLLQAGILISKQIKFVPVNFEIDNLKDALIAAEYSPVKKTLFIWEGVTYYLSSEVVDKMLTFVKLNSPSSSAIGFDYASLSEEALNEKGVKELRKLMQSQHAGESTRFGIRAGRIGAYLKERGFAVRKHLTAVDMGEIYLTTGGNLKAGKVPSLFCLVYATVMD